MSTHQKFMLFCLRRIALTILFGYGITSNAINVHNNFSADSVMQHVFNSSHLYNHIVKKYNAQLYIKTTMNIRKRNFALQYIPYLYRTDHRRRYIMESMNELHYTAPDIYDRKLVGVMGTMKGYHGVYESAMNFFYLNVYSPSLFEDKLCSPLFATSEKYYKYRLDSVYTEGGERKYRVSFTPRYTSFQLIQGWVVIGSSNWLVQTLYFKYRNEYMRCNVKVFMGTNGYEKYLPAKYEVAVNMKILGNKVDLNYLSYLKYREVNLFINNYYVRKKNKYDLSDAYNLTCDTKKVIADSAGFSHIRLIPLTEYEHSIYKDYSLQKTPDSIKLENHRDKSYDVWGEMGDRLLRSYNVDVRGLGNIHCSPIFNPLLLNYSHTDGISYKQVFKYNHLMRGDRLLRVAPQVGYNSKHSEFYFAIPVDVEYNPKRRATVHIEVGNGNRIYNTRLMEEIKTMPDSLFNFDNMHLDYFRDYYLNLNHSVEVFNGFQVYAGIMMHRRVAIHNSTIIVHDSTDIGDIKNRFKSLYNSFAPRITLKWTPGQYYYMNGRRKINLHSAYPTFTLDYERGISGVFGSNGKYERFEFDTQYHLPIGLIHDLYLRAGAGTFTDAQQIYFVDFANFAKDNLPVSWNDDIGGVFQLLDRRWYNASNSYARLNITYETPTLLLPHSSRLTKNVMKERLYFNLLSIPRITPYTEIGYGIGTHVFDFGIFASFHELTFKQIGCKFTIELFNK